jgi:hypothetical protein
MALRGLLARDAAVVLTWGLGRRRNRPRRGGISRCRHLGGSTGTRSLKMRLGWSSKRMERVRRIAGFDAD